MKFLLPLLTLFLWACAAESTETPRAEPDAPRVPTLTKLWETDTLMTTAEAVYYDAQRREIFVSNMNNGPWDRDENGFISRIGLDGKILEHKWATGGMSAPKGMTIRGDKLYVADLGDLVEIQMPRGEITNRYTYAGRGRFNDVTMDPAGTLYVSASDGTEVFALRDGKLEVAVDSLKSPNGILHDGNRLLIAQWNAKALSEADLRSKMATIRTEGINNPDGIQALPDGGYLVSSWEGKITYVDPTWKAHQILDTSGDKIGAADIEYIADQQLLIVPTFFHNRVMAYRVER